MENKLIFIISAISVLIIILIFFNDKSNIQNNIQPVFETKQFDGNIISNILTSSPGIQQSNISKYAQLIDSANKIIANASNNYSKANVLLTNFNEQKIKYDNTISLLKNSEYGVEQEVKNNNQKLLSNADINNIKNKLSSLNQYNNILTEEKNSLLNDPNKSQNLQNIEKTLENSYKEYNNYQNQLVKNEAILGQNETNNHKIKLLEDHIVKTNNELNQINNNIGLINQCLNVSNEAGIQANKILTIKPSFQNNQPNYDNINAQINIASSLLNSSSEILQKIKY